MIRASIVGGTGYTGVELLRLLAMHPQVEVVSITSRSESGLPVADLFPSLRGHYDLCFSEPDSDQLAEADVVFFATPHGVAQAMVPEILKRGARVIDLSADFRIKDQQLWEKWYNQTHACPELIVEAVYGLPEVNRAAIGAARLIACPGCYPTSVQLGFLPLLENDLVAANDLIANSASGASGAGRQAKIDNLHSEVSDSFKAYAAGGHRHLPEIVQGLKSFAGKPVGLTFVPHLLPIVRGIHSTLYATLLDTSVDLQALFEERYADEPFVDVMPPGAHPQTRSVRGSNVCHISVVRPQDGDKVVVMSAIDNLVKGASGQAVQNMNVMFGLAETSGLEAPPLLP
ncbi:MAG: N-acetyl-gamma-glutamyl-phosphate reductase [Candidatus Reddybacter sp.]